ncbi:MAG: TIR domain-containing protein [Oscillospiraceae bacterium]|nr:TIR domain-containing protein [Oscillospiraceae bacterium]
MDRKYKAFISYRHLPLDMNVAIKMHRRIEHYTIPRELRKNREKKLGYVFRDQDELPISSNLTENICTALDHSEYLIVICTPETGNSAWVLREISYFLEKHDRDHVLAVLADGTPDTSFPNQLTTFVSDDGTPVRIEPLAANIVAASALKRNRLFATESLRILATLIGCAFDELYKRELRYKRRRIGAAAALTAAVAAVFIGTLINRNREIRANYEQSLRNQSQYLAAESLNSLKEGDRLSAIYLAMEALPSGNNERPLVSKAEYALGCAVGAYTSPGNATGLKASGVISHEGDVIEFMLNESGSMLCSRCKDGKITGWDTDSMNALWTLSNENGLEFKGIAGYITDTDLIVWHWEGVCCINAATGEQKWECPSSELGSSVTRVCISESTNDIAAVCSSGVFLIDPMTGHVSNAVYWPEMEIDNTAITYNAMRSAVSPDGSMLAAQISLNGNGRGIAVIDLSDGSPRFSQLFPDGTYIPDQVLFTDNNRFFYISNGMSEIGAFSVLDMKAMKSSDNILHCIDLDTGETLWETKHRASTAGANDVLIYNAELTGQPILIYAYANHLDVLDPANGEFLADTEFSARLIGVDIVNRLITCVMDNGERGFIMPGDFSTWYTLKVFVDDIIYEKYLNESSWVLPASSNRIFRYQPMEADPEWSQIDVVWSGQQNENSFFDDASLVDKGCIAFVDDNRILLNDGDPAHPLREVDLPERGTDSGYMKISPATCVDGKLGLSWSDNTGCGVAYIDTNTLEHQVIEWTDPEIKLLAIYGSGYKQEWYAVGCKSISDSSENKYSIYALKLDHELNTVCILDVVAIAGQPEIDTCFDPKGRVYLYLPENSKCFCVDFDKSSVKECGTLIGECFAAVRALGQKPSDRCCFSTDGSLLAIKSGDKEWKVMTSDGSERISIRGDSSEILSASFTPDSRYLLTVETDGFMRRYSISDGKMLSKNELYFMNSVSNYTDINWKHSENGFLAVCIDDYLNLISMEDWGTFAYVAGCYGYIEDKDYFVCYDYSTGTKAYAGFRRYSHEALMDYGRSILNGWDMSETQRMEYGLD